MDNENFSGEEKAQEQTDIVQGEVHIVKSKSPIPFPNRPKILTPTKTKTESNKPKYPTPNGLGLKQ